MTMNKQGNTQEKRTVTVGRDVIKSIINTGDHNQFLIGDYEPLRDAYIGPWSVFERVNLKHFAGREWLLAEVDAFLRDNDRGYFILEAEAGVGKTTFLAWLTRERGYIHHFSELAPGLTGVGQGLKNLATQLVLGYHLNAYEAEGVLPGAATRPDYLLKLLKQAADERREGEKIVLVVDALDEAGTPPNQNVLGLPNVLPEGVYFIVSQRPVRVKLQVETSTTPRYPFRLSADSDQNLVDMRLLLQKAATLPAIMQKMQESSYTQEQFTTTLLQKCRGVWIYLHYIMHEIKRGERTPLDLDALPDGMTQYYARYWERWREEDEDKWDEMYLPLLTTLAAAQEAITIKRLTEWAEVKMPMRRLRRLLKEQWRPFLAMTKRDGQDCYLFYHATLREFFDGRVEEERLTEAEKSLIEELAEATREVHHRLAERYLVAWGGLDANLPGLAKAAQRDIDQGYGLRHLAAHLEASRRVRDLHRLLALETRAGRNVWHQVKEAVGDTAGYLVDVTRAWQLEIKSDSLANPKNTPGSISLQCQYALITASLHSYAQNIPLPLLEALVEHGVWTPTQGLAVALQKPKPEQRAEALTKLTPHLPLVMKEQAQEEILAVAQTIPSAWHRTSYLKTLIPRLSSEHSKKVIKKIMLDILKSNNDWYAMKDLQSFFMDLQALNKIEEALAIAQTIEPEEYRTKVQAVLSHRLVLGLVRRGHPGRVLAAAHAIESQKRQSDTSVALVPHLPSSKQKEVLQDTLAVARMIKDTQHRIGMLIALAGHFPLSEQEWACKNTLAIVQTIKKDRERVKVLTELARYMPASLRKQVVLAEIELMKKDKVPAQMWDMWSMLTCQLATVNPPREAWKIAHIIEDKWWRAKTLIELAYRLPTIEREQALREALTVVRTIKREGRQQSLLVELIPHLPTTEREQMQQEALAAARKISWGNRQIKILEELLPYLSVAEQEQVRQEMLAAMRLIEWIGNKVQILTKVIHLLPTAEQNQILQETLSAAQAIRTERERVTALTRLSPYLPAAEQEQVLQEALATARVIEGEESREQLLTTLVPHLTAALVPEALRAAREIQDKYSQAKVLVVLVRRLAELDQLEEALMVTRTIQSERYRAEALGAIVSYLPETEQEDVLLEALAAVRASRDDEHRAKVLENLVPHLPASLLGKALAAAKTIEDENWRTKTIAAMAPKLVKLSPDDLYPLWQETLSILTRSTRSELLTGLSALVPVIVILGGQEAVRETFRAVQDVCRWWP